MFDDYEQGNNLYHHKTPESFSLPGSWSFSGEVRDGSMESRKTFSILVEEEIVPVTGEGRETDRRMAAEALDKLRKDNLELHAGKLSAEATLSQAKEKHRVAKETLRSDACAYQQTQEDMVKRLQTSEMATNSLGLDLKRVTGELNVATDTVRELRAELVETYASQQATEEASFRLQGELEYDVEASENLNSELRAELETTRSSQQAGEIMTKRLQSELRSLRSERAVLAESVQVPKLFIFVSCVLRVHIAVFCR
jgi:chromosome segregation ATPase